MANSPSRRLNLADLAILVAASAVGFWVLRLARESRASLSDPNYIRPYSIGVGLNAAPFLLSTAAALLVARALPPRPSWREAARQPGTIACLMILGSPAVYALLWFLSTYSARLRGGGYQIPFHSYLSLGMRVGDAVAITWATLALAGAWRAEPSWVDRAGRVLGAVAILLWVASAAGI